MIKDFLKQKFNKDILKNYALTLILTAIATILQLVYFHNTEHIVITNIILALCISIPFTAKFEGIAKYKSRIFKRYYFFVVLNLIFLYLYTREISDNEKVLSLFLLASFYISFFFLSPSKELKDEKNNLKYFVNALSSFINSIIFSIVLHLGLIFIVFSLKELFSINFSYDIYGKIFVAVTGFFFVPVFLTSNEEEKENLYSKFLEFLLLKVIFPLLVIYLFILYAYILKIIFNKIYPKNIVPYLTLFYALGASFFYYTTKLLENRFLSIFRKYFFYTVIPLVIMTYFSILPRIMQYSLTENRYFILIAAFWLTILIVFSIFSKKSNILFFRNSFLVLLFISSLGPLSSINLSKYFQRAKLAKLLKMPKENVNSQELYNLINYFYTKHEITHTGLTKDELSPEDLMKNLGYKYESNKYSVKNWFNFQDKTTAYEIKDYDYFISNLSKPVSYDKTTFELNKNNEIVIKEGNLVKKISINDLAKDFSQKAKGLEPNNAGQYVIDLQSKKVLTEIKKEILITFKDLNFNIDNNEKVENLYFDFYIFVKNTK